MFRVSNTCMETWSLQILLKLFGLVFDPFWSPSNIGETDCDSNIEWIPVCFYRRRFFDGFPFSLAICLSCGDNVFSHSRSVTVTAALFRHLPQFAKHALVYGRCTSVSVACVAGLTLLLAISSRSRVCNEVLSSNKRRRRAKRRCKICRNVKQERWWFYH